MDPVAERIAALPPAKRALLEAKLRVSEARLPAGPALVRRGGGDGAPLSFSQQRLWFLHALDPGSALYNVPRAFRLRGRLDAAALRRALEAVVARHEVLRTRIVSGDGVPRQTVEPAGAVPLPVVHLAGLPDGVRAREALARLRDAAAQPFDLSAGPVLRAALLRLGPDEHLLLLTVHHVASDGWSTHVLAADLSAAYAAALRGEPAALPELPLQYADYAAWQRERLAGSALDGELGYWREKLAGAEVLELPADHPRPPVQSFRGRKHGFAISPALRDRCRTLAGEARATPFMVLLSAFYALLGRYTGRTDLLVGSPVAGRSRSEVEPLVGFFVNTLPLRGDLAGDPSFRQLVARTRETAMSAMLHQEVPFERLVEELRPERDPSRSPLVQVMFALQNTPPQVLALPGATAEPVEIDLGIAKFDLTLFLHEEGPGPRGVLEYAADLFEPETAARIAARFVRLLEGAAAAPDRPLSSLALLDPAERLHLTEGVNRTERPFPRDASLPGLFAARAAASPGSVALEHGGTRTTYAELDERSCRLAGALAAAGVEPGGRVGLLLERSPRMVEAMLGVLRAGGAYVPLDPSHPPERLRAVAEDAGVRVLLARGAVPPALVGAARVLDVDEALSAAPLAPRWSPGGGDPAYVIYTSGSTGTPKGVVVSNRAVARLVVGTDYVRLGPGDAVAHLANPAFDAATWEVWGALLNGARLVVVDRDDAISPARLRAVLRDRGVSALFLTTALFNTVAREAPDAFATVRHVLFGGEACDPAAVRRVLDAGAPERLLHVYGPTETTTFATWHPVAELPEGRTVPIGLPVADARAYVLDAQMEPVPAEVPGELYVGGDGVAAGYAGRPGLTAERFLPDPFSREPGARMYRTGDRVRRRPGGELEFLGRVDRQVKVRGFRIEPGEVEAVLGGFPGAEGVAVTVREDASGAPGGRRLVAYAAPDSLDVEALRRFARERLPDYMVPAAWVLLAGLPLTPNGKVDRPRLPAPELPAASARYAAPRDMLEDQVAAIWEELLGVQPVGIRDDFFELGGHSLLAVRMMSRVEERFGRAVPLAALFAGATVADLAAALRREWPEGDAEPVVTLNGDGARPPLFFLHGDVSGGGLYGLTLARCLGADQPLHLLPPLHPDPGETGPGVREMARRQLETIRGVQPRGPYRLGGYCNGGLVAYEAARLLRRRASAWSCCWWWRLPARTRTTPPCCAECSCGDGWRETGRGSGWIGSRGCGRTPATSTAS
ncbi:MAG TPA: amino acid adenylation domain-containing protein [Longimicrobiaceae bacterium]|nr:amino acid adenylation domain-containing protein [Longimicrobiaceae bacterium]